MDGNPTQGLPTRRRILGEDRRDGKPHFVILRSPSVVCLISVTATVHATRPGSGKACVETRQRCARTSRSPTRSGRLSGCGTQLDRYRVNGPPVASERLRRADWWWFRKGPWRSLARLYLGCTEIRKFCVREPLTLSSCSSLKASSDLAARAAAQSVRSDRRELVDRAET